MRHPHADTIIAWAEGKEIQIYSTAKEEWIDLITEHPLWDIEIKYRVKPTDYILYSTIGPLDLEYEQPTAFIGDAKEEKPRRVNAIKIVFDVESHEPKFVELIKG